MKSDEDETGTMFDTAIRNIAGSQTIDRRKT